MTYAYLTIERADRDAVNYPDGSRDVVAAGEGTPRAAAWVEPGHADDGSRSQTAEDADVQRWLIKHQSWQQRLEAELANTRSIIHYRELREAFLEENPEPRPPAGMAPDMYPLNDTPTPPERRLVITRELWWISRLGSDGNERLLSTDEGYPGDAVALHLTDLARDGWRVVDQQLHRAVQHTEIESVAYVSGALILLERAP